MNQRMSEKDKISDLLDLSGNLTVNAMEKYLLGELDQLERKLLEKHLEESPFDREALDGLRKFYPSQRLHDIEELQQDVSQVARKYASTEKHKKLTPRYWYAAAGIIAILGLTVVMVFMFRNPVNQSQLAITQTDTMIGTESGESPQEQEQSVSENELEPVTQQDTRITITEDIISVDKPNLEDKITKPGQIQLEKARSEPEAIIYMNKTEAEIIEDDVRVESDMVGGVMKSEEESFEMEMSAQGQKGVSAKKRTISKMAMNEEADTHISESQIFMEADRMPEFPGGEDSLSKYLADNIIYPQMAIENSIQGQVFITFVVETDSTISNVNVLRGIGGGCDEEAVRVIESMPKWIPGMQRGKPVRVQYNMPIMFSLE